MVLGCSLQAPLSVKRNGDQLRVQAYLASVVSDGTSMMATIEDECEGIGRKHFLNQWDLAGI